MNGINTLLELRTKFYKILNFGKQEHKFTKDTSIAKQLKREITWNCSLENFLRKIYFSM